MTSSRIMFNKGSYRLSISKKVIDEFGLQEKGSTKPINIIIEKVKKHNCLMIHNLRFRDLPDPSLKELPIDKAIAEGYFDDDDPLSGKRQTFRKGFVDLSHLPDEIAQDPRIQKIKEEADIIGRRILDSYREYDRKTREDVKKYNQLHSSFKYWVNQGMENMRKRPRSCDTNKPSQYDKI